MTDLSPVTAALESLQTAFTNYATATATEVATLEQQLADAQGQAVDLQPLLDKIAAIRALIPAST